MEEIKTTLAQLKTFFSESAADETLVVPIRRFAAQLTILTAHVERVEALALQADQHVAELANIMIAARQARVERKAAPPNAPQQGGASPTAPPAAQPAPADEEAATEAMVSQIERETAADLAAASALQNGGAS